MGDNGVTSSTDVEKGKWIWIAQFSQGSRWHTTKEYRIHAFPSSFSSLEETTEELTIDTTEEYHMDESSSEISSLEDTAEELTIDTTMLFTSEVTVSTMPSYEVESNFALMGEMEILVPSFISLFAANTN
ncbi:hypothetical protein SUGI_0669420 [Cryptomeria japonica]|nr:hypothetical protein SUGI_0669420 [Cryptomeria japonica]